MLAKGPDDRYASAVELLRDLRQVQVEGLDANWSGDVLDLDMSEQLVFSESPIGATRRLEAIMKESVETSAGRGSRWRWAAAILAAFLTGSMLAWSTRSDDLLGELPEVPKKESVEAQFWYATMMPSREAWESVWAYFPANDDLDPKVRALNKQYKRRAQQQLARFYLAKKDYDPALQIFRELGRAGVESSWKELEAFGLAGQAVVYYRQGKLEEYTDKWPDAQALSEYLDEDMKAELERIGPQSQEPTGTPAEPTTRS
jgi:tetratricopeptide (TPR) repeat protein